MAKRGSRMMNTINDGKISDDESDTCSEPQPKRSRETPPILPFSDKLKFDECLNLSRKDFKNVITVQYCNEGSKSLLECFKDIPQFPSPYIMAYLSKKAYIDRKGKESDNEFEKRLNLCNGWEVLTTASNGAFLNGYRGRAFVNKSTQQIILAHRGSWCFGSYKADVQCIYLDRFGCQMSSACTFAYIIHAAMEQINKETGKHFQLFLTGHSLGAWLAQITAFSLKYLTRNEQENVFLFKSFNGYHARTVVFDSPGADYMLRKLAKTFCLRYDVQNLSRFLDITTYLSTPNIVNSVQLHVGQLYCIYPNLTTILDKDEDEEPSLSKTVLKNLLKYSGIRSLLNAIPDEYTTRSHSLLRIILEFDPETGEPKKYKNTSKLMVNKVLDWPLLAVRDNKFENFLKCAKEFDSYDPVEDCNENDTIEHVPYHYRTIPYNNKECAASVFTTKELAFLEVFQRLSEFEVLARDSLRGISNKPTELRFILNRLNRIKIQYETVVCKSPDALRIVIPFVKRLLSQYPNLLEKVKTAMTSEKLRKMVFEAESLDYRKKLSVMCENLKEISLPEMDSFFTSQNLRIWNLIVSERNTDIVAAQIIQALKCSENNYFEKCYTLDRNILTINKYLKFTELLQSLSSFLVIVEFGSGSNEEDQEFLLSVFEKLNKPNAKLILITQKKDEDLQNCILKNTEIHRKTTEAPVLMWKDLTLESKKKLLNKELVNLQGCKKKQISLKNLLSINIDDNIQNLPPFDEFDSSTIRDLLKSKSLRIGNPLEVLQEVNYIGRCFKEEFEVKKDILRHDSNDKIAVSGASIEELLSFKALRDTISSFDDSSHSKIIILDDNYQENCYKILCTRYTNIHWLTMKENKLFWQHSHGNLELVRLYSEELREICQNQSFLGEKCFVTEKKLVQRVLDKKFYIIADVAGMGKSTLLTNLARLIKSSHQNLWVVKINLNDCAKVLEKELEEQLESRDRKTSQTEVKDLVVKMLKRNKRTKLKRPLDILLFKHSLHAGNVVLLFDAVDEISPDYENIFVEMLANLKDLNLKSIIVTTRQHTKNKIEDALCTFSLRIMPFTKENQLKYMELYWSRNLNKEKKAQLDLKSKARNLVDKFSRAIGDRTKDFLGIPLNCNILAKILAIQALKKGVKELLVDNEFSLLNLYEKFETMREDDFKKEKSTGSANVIVKKALTKMIIELKNFHQKLATKLLLEDIDPEYTQSDLDEDALKFGLVVRIGGKLDFIHRTFAEFFLSKHFAESLANGTHTEEIIHKIFLKKEFEVTRSFLNSYMERQSYEQSISSFSQCLTSTWNENQTLTHNEKHETILHICVRENLKNIFKFIIDCCLKDEITAHKMADYIGTLSNSKKNSKTSTQALHFAALQGKSDWIEHFSKKLENLSDSAIKVVLLASLLNYESPKALIQNFNKADRVGKIAQGIISNYKKKMIKLHNAAKKNSYQELNKIFSYQDESVLHYLMMSRVKDSKLTALHTALLNANIEVAKFLFEVAKKGTSKFLTLKLINLPPYEPLLQCAEKSGTVGIELYDKYISLQIILE